MPAPPAATPATISLANPLPPVPRSPRAVWFAAALLALAAHALILLLANPVFQTNTPETSPLSPSISPASSAAAPPRHPTIHAPSKIPDEMRARADLSDVEPLFLSTPRNYGYVSPEITAASIGDVDGGPLAEPISPRLTVRPGAPLAPAELHDPSHSAPPPRPLHRLLPLAHWRPAATLGHRPQPPPTALAPRRARMRVEDFATGETVHLDGIPFEHDVPLEFPRDADTTHWRPAAFSVWVDALGPVAPPLPLPNHDVTETTGAPAASTAPVTAATATPATSVAAATSTANSATSTGNPAASASTGNPAADLAIRAYLTAPFSPLTRLPPGHYRITLGP